MTSTTQTREIRLRRRPAGMPSPTDFRTVRTTLPALGAGEILVRNTWLSVDPYMRGRMGATPNYVPYDLHAPLAGAAVGEVIASESDQVPVGAMVRHTAGWREHSVVADTEARVLDTSVIPAETYLGALGNAGLTAYVGMTRIAGVGSGDVVFVSGAAGAVGSVAGQVARNLGASAVIGSAGGAEKVRHLVDELGYDQGLDYRQGSLLEQLRRAAPDGIDVCFDNVGYEHLVAAVQASRRYARFALCGAIAGYNGAGRIEIPGDLQLVEKRLTLRGFTVADHRDLAPEWEALALGWIASGALHVPVTVTEGLDSTVGAFIGLFHGANLGKALVRL